MNHNKYIQRCLQIAQNGIGSARPNPSVGAVVVWNDMIIGEGYTSPYGGSHAEVNAINAVVDKSVLKEATIYVTLEPCAHYGKTPPCADLIVSHQIPRVVIGAIDTNSLVAGKGVERLQKAGCEVIVGVLEEACLTHHKRFFTVQNKQRPYIILKWAATQDGFIAPLEKNVQEPVWISNSYAQQLVHKWRSEEHAILVGTNTVLVDNPKLTVRSWTGNNPIRVVLDQHLRIPKTASVLDGTTPTIVITGTTVFPELQQVTYETIDFNGDIAIQISEVLQKHRIQSVIIEGGAQTLATFVKENLWDEARVFIGKATFGSGIKAPEFSGNITTEKNILGDVLKIYMND